MQYLHNINIEPEIQERVIELERTGYYDITNCYASKEVYENEALIKGVYIVRNRLLGELPFCIKIILKKHITKNNNFIVLKNLYSRKLGKYRSNCVIVNDEKIRMIGIFEFVKSYKKLGNDNHFKYKSLYKIPNNKTKKDNIINNIFIHKKYLPEKPEHMYFEVEFPYKELPPEEPKPVLFMGEEVIIQSKPESITKIYE